MTHRKSSLLSGVRTGRAPSDRVGTVLAAQSPAFVALHLHVHAVVVVVVDVVMVADLLLLLAGHSGRPDPSVHGRRGPHAFVGPGRGDGRGGGTAGGGLTRSLPVGLALDNGLLFDAEVEGRGGVRAVGTDQDRLRETAHLKEGMQK